MGKIIYNIFGEKVYTIPFGNFIFKCSPNLISYQNRARIFWGYYERAEIVIFKIDIGALVNCKQMIIELHPLKLNEKNYSIADMISIITKKLNFNLIDNYANVFVFDKIENETK